MEQKSVLKTIICCVFWLAFGYCVHPKAGQYTFLHHFQPFLFIFNFCWWRGVCSWFLTSFLLSQTCNQKKEEVCVVRKKEEEEANITLPVHGTVVWQVERSKIWWMQKNYYPSIDGCYFTIWGMVLNQCAWTFQKFGLDIFQLLNYGPSHWSIVVITVM